MAFWQALDYPYWALTIVYVLVQPSGGSTRLKAGYIMIGALSGVIVAIGTTGLFGGVPLVHFISLVLFLMIVSVGALRDRRPRFYAYLLAGVTGLLIAMPGIALPDQVFNRAVGRIEAVLLAIFLYLAIDALFFINEQKNPALVAASDWVSDLRVLTVNFLREESISEISRSSIFLRAVQLIPLIDSVKAGGASSKWRYEVIISIVERGVRLITLLFTLSDLDNLSKQKNIRSRYWSEREKLATWIEHGCPNDNSSKALHKELRRSQKRDGPTHIELISNLCHIRYLRGIYMAWRKIQYDHNLKALSELQKSQPIGRPLPATIGHVDLSFALKGSLSVGIFAAAMGWLWEGAGLPASAVALGLLMGMALCIMASNADDPALALISLIKLSIITFFVTAIYIQGVFPEVSSFPTLAIVLFPALFLLGLVVQKPGGIMFAILPMALIRIGNGQVGASITDIINSLVGFCICIGILFIVKMLFHRPSFLSVTKNILYKNRFQLIEFMRNRPSSNQKFYLDALDRFSFFETRLFKLRGLASFFVFHPSLQVLRELRLGIRVNALYRYESGGLRLHSEVFGQLKETLEDSINQKKYSLTPWVTEQLYERNTLYLNQVITSGSASLVSLKSLFEINIVLREIKNTQA